MCRVLSGLSPNLNEPLKPFNLGGFIAASPLISNGSALWN